MWFGKLILKCNIKSRSNTEGVDAWFYLFLTWARVGCGWSARPLSFFNGLCAQKFQIVQIFSPQLQETVHIKRNACKIMILKLFLVNIIILIGTKIVIVCCNKTGNKQDNNK